MDFSRELRSDVLSGDITVTFRRWSRAHVKVGSCYLIEHGQIEVDSIDLVPFASITDADLALAGEEDRETLRERAAHTGPIDDDTMLYRIEFHVVD